MIRLTVFGADGPLCNEIDRRLRGAISVVSATALPSGTSLAAIDVLAFIGSRTPYPDELHQIIQHGKPVLLANDKVFSMEGLDAVLDQESTESRIVIVNPDRSLPSRRLISDELRGAKFGPVGLIRSHRWESSWTGRVVDANELPSSLLRDLDLVVWLKQASPNLVFATQSSIADSSTGPGAIQVHLGFDDGTMALVGYSDGLAEGEGYQSLSVICANGAMSADDHPNRQLVFGDGAAEADPSDKGILALVSLIQQFVDGLSSADASKSGIAAWSQVRALANCVRRSLDSRQAVSWVEF